MPCVDVEEGDGDSMVFYSALVIVVLTEGRIDPFIEQTHSVHNILTDSEGVPVREATNKCEVCGCSPSQFLELPRFKPHVITCESPTVV